LDLPRAAQIRSANRRGTRDLGPSDLDPTDGIHLKRYLILAVALESDGSNPFLPRTGTRAYQPSDQDLTTLTRPRLDLIRSIGLRSGGQDYADAPAAVQVAGDALPRRRYAGDGQTWPSGLRLARDHAVEEAGGTGNPPGLSSWRIGARVGDSRGEGGSGRRSRRRACVPGAIES
jgi:hypothetical protein